MYGWMFLGFSTVLALREILRLIRGAGDQDLHAYAHEVSERNSHRDPSFGSPASNINTLSSRNDTKDSVYQSDPSRIYFHESYPKSSNITSPSTSSTNKSMEGTTPTPLPDHQSKPFPSQSSSLPSDQSGSSSAKAKAPAKASQSRSSFKNPPSLKPTLSPQQSENGNNKSRKGTKPTPSADQSKPSSSKLPFSPLPSNSRNQPKKANSKLVVQKGTSPSCMIPKDIENLIKEDIVADVSKKPLSPAIGKDCFAPLRNAEDFHDEYRTRAKTSVTPNLELNFMGLPIRPGVKDCPYYMRNGACMYETNCKFNHPNPTAEGDSDSPSGYAYGGSVSSNAASQASIGSWSSPTALNKSSPNPSQNSEWNGYQDTENLIKKDIVPDVLKKPLSPATYKDYFAALLYAEDFYMEKWSNFQLLDVTLEFYEASIYDKSPKNKNLKKSAEKDEKIFVALKLDSVADRRPIILSGDFVFVRRSGSEAKKFQGIVYRVVKSNVVLVEFEEGFYYQRVRNFKYDISFLFNRVCLKRAHQAISAAASGSFFDKYLFPEHAIRKNICSSISGHYVSSNHILDLDSISAIRQILSFNGHPPYLVEGPLCASSSEKQKLSKTGLVVQEAVLQIYQRSPSNCRILICSPLSNTRDILLRSVKSRISESVMFRANAAFREVDGVPDDILSFCVYERECFSIPSLQQLKEFRIIFSTFVSSFCLLNEGITVGHFSHIFLVDASSATEPETMIPLSNLANESTTVILTGAPNNQTSWVRSDIAKKNGLRTSYFERLRATKIYRSSDPSFITQL